VLASANRKWTSLGSYVGPSNKKNATAKKTKNSTGRRRRMGLSSLPCPFTVLLVYCYALVRRLFQKLLGASIIDHWRMERLSEGRSDTPCYW